MYQKKPQTNPRYGNTDAKTFQYNGKMPDDRHWLSRIKETLKRSNLWINDEDVNNLWFIYSLTNGNLKRWLQDDTLLDKLKKEPATFHTDMESVKQTVRKVSESAIRQIIVDAR